MITDRFDAETKIVFATLTGKISMQEILAWFDTITPDRFPVRNLRMASDATGAEYDFETEKLEHSKKAFESLCSRFDDVRIAVLHSKPKETAFSQIISDRIRLPNYSQRVFSDTKPAIWWLLEE
jgi:hypothetical protein